MALLGGSRGGNLRYDSVSIRSRLFSLGLLRRNALAAKSWESYQSCTLSFLCWLDTCRPQPSCHVSLDLFVVRYCEIQHDDDPRRGSRQHCVNVQSGLEFVCAELKGLLQHARQALRSWGRLVPPRSPPPLSYDILMALSGFSYN